MASTVIITIQTNKVIRLEKLKDLLPENALMEVSGCQCQVVVGADIVQELKGRLWVNLSGVINIIEEEKNGDN